MLIHVKGVLTREEVAHARQIMAQAPWVDGGVTSGEQARSAKNNWQIEIGSPQSRELGDMVLNALGRSPVFTSAALPLRVMPPLFNRYDVGMQFGMHVDNCIRTVPGATRMRCDISSTLFFSDPDEYDGGELIVEDIHETRRVKLPAGDMILYPTVSLHAVTEITRGSRIGSFFWTQSMIKDNGNRALLHELDLTIMGLRQKLPDNDRSILQLTNTYHKLMRQWSEM